MTCRAPDRVARVLVRPEFWSDAECVRARSAIDRGHAASAEIYDRGYIVDERVRKTYDVDVESEIVERVEQSLAAVRADVSRFFGTTLTGTEGPGFLRYPPGGFYLAHRDCLEHADVFQRQISIVLFLSSVAAGPGDGCCEGGTLRLYGVGGPLGEAIPLDIAPAAGTLVAFPSDVLHEVCPVTAGVRDAIVDWFY
jgi:predicted 2-oxoglutarate/Fe(II)-dependent dioxygenase YbiX